MLIDFFHDFETRSKGPDLVTAGTVKYATHPTTEVTLLTYAIGRSGTIKAWRKGQPVPDELMNVVKNPHIFRMIAWNIQFDYMIWTQVFSRLFPPGTLVKPPIENLEDAMAVSCYFRTGGSLESAAQMCGMPQGKDLEGRKLMLKQCKPNSRTGEYVELTPDEWVKFERYGIQDTRLLRDVYYMLPPLPVQERWAWEWTFRRNLRGLRLDQELVNVLKEIVADAMPGLVAEWNHCTGGKFTWNSHVKVREFFQPYYPWIKDMTGDTMRDMLRDPRPVPPNVRRALEIKNLAGSTSITKLEAVSDRVFAGMIYEILAYCWAGTQRWAGRGPQIQNYPRVDDDLLDNFWNKDKPNYRELDLNVHDLAGEVRKIRHTLKDPIGFVKNLLRRMWIPSPGNHFYSGDFAKIEPTVLFWLVDLGAIPKKWYEEMASEIYDIPPEKIGKESQERQVGKTAALSCGYGAGWESFITKTYEDTGIMLSEQMSKQVIGAYRRKYKQVVDFWSDLQTAFRLAIYGQSSSLCRGKIYVMPMQALGYHPHFKGVVIRLPNGSHLFYHGATERTEVHYLHRTEKDSKGKPVKITEQHWQLLAPILQGSYEREVKTVLKYVDDQGKGKLGYEYVYGGKLCENVTSATARNVLVPAMWRLENAGIDVLGTVHDELWGDTYPGREKEFEELMCVRPSWCPDMAIAAEVKGGVRYLK